MKSKRRIYEKIKEDKYEFPLVGTLVECNKCGRKILVERVLMGVNHTMHIIATCWDCLKPGIQKKAIKTYQISKSEK